MAIHPSAIVDARARVHPQAEIGPYVVIEGPVKIGRGTRVMSHAVLLGWTEVGEENEIHTGVVLGDAPQDKAYGGQETYLRTGDRNIFREYVQVHRGTAPASATLIGNDNFFMAASHVAHNCRVGDHVVLANGALLGGYVEVGNRAFISAHCVVHQYCRVGELALMRGLSGTSRDVPPYSIVDWQHTVRGLNIVGLKRAGFDEPRIRALKEAFRILFRKGRNLALALRELEDQKKLSADVESLVSFIKSSRRGVCFRG